MNQAVIPYVPQPTAVIAQPAVGFPAVPGYGTAADYYHYTNPAYGGYPTPVDYNMYPGGYIPRGTRRLWYPRKRSKLQRLAEALFLGQEAERLRAIEMSTEMGYGPYGGMYSRGLIDEGYGQYRRRGSYGYHPRGCRCPDCEYDYYY